MAAKVAGVVRQVAGGRQPLSRPVVDGHYCATGYWRYITLIQQTVSHRVLLRVPLLLEDSIYTQIVAQRRAQRVAKSPTSDSESVIESITEIFSEGGQERHSKSVI